jgi:hypothetical protein
VTYFKDGEHLWKWKGLKLSAGGRRKSSGFLMEARLSKTANPQFFYIEASAFIYTNNRTVSCQVNSHPLEVRPLFQSRAEEIFKRESVICTWQTVLNLNQKKTITISTHSKQVYLYDATALQAWPFKLPSNGSCAIPRYWLYAATQEGCKEQCRLQKDQYNNVEIWGSRGPFACICTQDNGVEDGIKSDNSENATKIQHYSMK